MIPEQKKRDVILLPLRIAERLAREGKVSDRELVVISNAALASLEEEGLKPTAGSAS